MADHVFPEDAGTGASEGDYDDAANFASLAHATGLKDYVVQGLNFTLNAATPSLDISKGKAVVTDNAAQGNQSTETRDGVAFVAEMDARTGIGLTDGDVNHVFLQVDLSSDDTINIIVNTTGSSPSEPFVKLGTVDTSGDTVSEINRDVPVKLSELSSHLHSELDGVGAADHHSRYTDEEAQDSVWNNFSTGSNLSFTYDDAGNSASLSLSGSLYTDEDAQDAVGTILSSQFTYDDAGNAINIDPHASTSDAHHVRFGNSSSDNVTDIPNRDVEDLTSQGSSGQVAVAQGDGTVQMEDPSGGLEFLSDVEQFQSYKKAFNSIRNRRDYIEYVLDNDEDRADEITSSQVLTHYVFEAENDAYDRFIDPNTALGLMAFSQGDQPNLTEIYEVALFFAPTTFYEGLMTIESVADTITNSSVLMDGVMEADPILRNQFGKQV